MDLHSRSPGKHLSIQILSIIGEDNLLKCYIQTKLTVGVELSIFHIHYYFQAQCVAGPKSFFCKFSFVIFELNSSEAPIMNI